MNFLQKNSGRISPSTPEVELGSFKDLSFLKYYNAQEWECIFIVGLKTAKDIDYIEKYFKQTCKIKFPTKNSVEAYLSILEMELVVGLQKFIVFEI